jgi:hypothetical protein
MDIEGMETDVISSGMPESIGQNNLKFACCTYHKPDDAEVLDKLFHEYGYSTEFSEGYLAWGVKPYFRKAVIRAWM